MFRKKPWESGERMIRAVKAIKLAAPARVVLGKNTMRAS